jgi:hypothetical protein
MKYLICALSFMVDLQIFFDGGKHCFGLLLEMNLVRKDRAIGICGFAVKDHATGTISIVAKPPLRMNKEQTDQWYLLCKYAVEFLEEGEMGDKWVEDGIFLS